MKLHASSFPRCGIDRPWQKTPGDYRSILSLYIAEMAVKHGDAFIRDHQPDPHKPDPVARLLGARLIRETSRFISQLRKQGIIINELYAVGTSPFGIRMCQELGMTPMDLPEGVREKRVPFQINLQEANSP